jgi:HlyD family secretion protein
VVLLAVSTGCDGTTSGSTEYRLAEIARGPISTTISATGKLQAVVTVDVGTQVSGLIAHVDVDFNSPVAAGQVIARIDAQPFEAMLGQAEAELAVANANVLMQKASLEELAADLQGARAGFTEAEDELERKKSLLGRGAASTSTVETAEVDHEQAGARVDAGLARLAKQRAQIDLAKARVLQAASLVEQRRLDLEYTNIRSPVDGVVIRRDVDAGQTVASSLQAPVLFRIAGDLRSMEVDISVDEADIGRVREAQRVYFSVDSFPERTFEGRVHQIRMGGHQISNVVTYPVIVRVDNADGRLLPGMTANSLIVVGEEEDVLQVPSAALRLRLPSREETAMQGSWIWLLGEADAPQRWPVVEGLTNGEFTAISGEGLSVGRQVIIGFSVPGNEASTWQSNGR